MLFQSFRCFRFCVGGSTISTRTKYVEVSRKVVETVVLILKSFSFRIDRSFEFLEFYADSFTVVEEAVILIITCECSRVVTVSGLIYVKLWLGTKLGRISLSCWPCCSDPSCWR